MKNTCLPTKFFRRSFIQDLGYTALSIPFFTITSPPWQKQSQAAAQSETMESVKTDDRNIGVALVGLGRDSNEQLALDFKKVNQQALQMDDFATCILQNKPTRVPGEMGLRDVKMRAIYQVAPSGKRIELRDL